MLHILIIPLIVSLISLAIGAWWNSRDEFNGGAVTFLLIGIAGLIISGFIGLFFWKWQPSSASLTGYIYQRQDRYGYVDYSLRFSQNAGMDSQPSFCVESGSEQDIKLKEYVGTDKKVEVFVPSKGLRFESSLFACSSYAEFVKEIE